MTYMDVNTAANKWNVSERSVRNYCNEGRIPGVVMKNGSWVIPMDAEKPARKQRAGKIPTALLPRLKMEKESGITGGIYHKVQIELTYNSNHIEGSRLTHDETRYIFETNTIGIKDESGNISGLAILKGALIRA